MGGPVKLPQDGGRKTGPASVNVPAAFDLAALRFPHP